MFRKKLKILEINNYNFNRFIILDGQLDTKRHDLFMGDQKKSNAPFISKFVFYFWGADFLDNLVIPIFLKTT